MNKISETKFNTIAELTAAEARLVNGGATRAAFSSFSLTPTRQSETKFPDELTIKNNSGTYDEWEAVCIMDD